jgi:hypothetical protein
MDAIRFHGKGRLRVKLIGQHSFDQFPSLPAALGLGTQRRHLHAAFFPIEMKPWLSIFWQGLLSPPDGEAPIRLLECPVFDCIGHEFMQGHREGLNCTGAQRNAFRAGLEHPQAAVYVPGIDRIAVSSQSGKLRFYDAESYALVKTLDFGANADTDNIRYDPVLRHIYVGYGDGSRGSLAVVDPAAMERLEEFKLGSHPELFQLERDGPRIFVNLPDQESIGVIDQKTSAVTKWKIPGHTNVHALALDEAGHRLFAASLQPGRLTVVDTQSGRVVVTLPCILGVDDIWFDPTRKRIYAPGAGAIDVFQQVDPDPLHDAGSRPGRGRGREHELSSQDAHPGQLVHVLA